jgi:O-antigen ligase
LAICLGVWSYKTGRVNKNALADGLITDLRFPIFFIITAVTAYNSKFLKKYWQAILLIPASLVVVFGITQLFLPIDFLRHFGYGPKTIPAYETVDQNTRFHRIQSTLRGANPLGAYLIVVIPACFIGLKKYKWLKLALALASIVALFFTYSRSAYVGVFLSLIVLYYLVWLNHKWRKQFMIACSGLAIVFVLLIVAFRYNSVAQDVLFHTSKSSKSSTSSNAQHLTALKLGLHDVLHQPFGEGPGTAGPASVHNNHPPRIAENYYVQVAQEMGLLGVAIFVAINIMVGLRLWQRQKDPLASLLLASLIGISLVNLVSHAWADDTLSLLWWGMAGIALTPAIIKKDKLKKA